MSDFILRQNLKPGLVRLTMNRPQQFNALSEQMMAAMARELETIAQQPQTKVVILAGAGRAFCAGHDLKEMRAEPSEAYYKALFSQCSELMLALQRLPQPVIAQVQGIATAAGCQLVAMCDLALAGHSARFAVSGVNLGLFCSTPSVALSRNIGRKQAMQMLLTGEFIDAAKACDWGLVNQVVADDDLAAQTEALADQILAKPAGALRLGKQLFYAQMQDNMARAYELACHTMASNMMQDTALEGVQAFIEKRSPRWPT